MMNTKATKHLSLQITDVRHSHAPPAPEASCNPRFIGTRTHAIQDGLAG
jgi:hypothetical protein